MRNVPRDELADCIRKSVKRYFKDLDGTKPSNLYKMVINAVEKPLINIVLDYVNGNQSLAAEILGIDRNTLRKKIINNSKIDNSK